MSEQIETSEANARKPLVSTADVPVDSLPIITIPEGELHAAEIAGAERAMDHSGTIQQHELGARGEYAVAKYLGVEERFDTEVYPKGDDGFDLVYSGAKLQVKTASRIQNNPQLLVPTHQDLTSDYYILVQDVSRPVFRLLGYTDRRTVREAPIFHGIQVTEAYSLDQDRLEPFPPPPTSPD